MLKRILITSLFLFASLNASAAFIYADDFTIGQNVTYLNDNATLGWQVESASPGVSQIHAPGGFSHQHFGAKYGAATYGIWPAMYLAEKGSPYKEQYSVLKVSFTTAVRSFGFRAETTTPSPFGIFLYDTAGNFLKSISAEFQNTGTKMYQEALGFSIYDATYTYNFDFDVGQIKIGGTADTAYIYALDVDVPEPSTLVLLFAGLFSIFALRRVKSV